MEKAAPAWRDLPPRMTPANVEAEQALLGALLSNNRAIEKVVGFLRAEHFADPVNATIYEVIVERAAGGESTDATLLRQLFTENGILDDVGGQPYLAKLLAAMVGITVAPDYARAIEGAFLERRLLTVCDGIAGRVWAEGSKPGGREQVAIAERELAALVPASARGGGVVRLADAARTVAAEAEAVYRTGRQPALTTGLRGFDEATGGLWPATLTLLAGIPGAGKTALAAQVSEMAAAAAYRTWIERGVQPAQVPGVLFLSREMSPDEVAARSVSRRIGLSARRFQRGDLDLDRFGRLPGVLSDLGRVPVDVFDCRGLPLALLQTRARMLLQRRPFVLGVLDHLLVAEGSDSGKRGRGSDAGDVSAAAQGFKNLAAEFKMPWLVLTQLRKATREDRARRPILDDVKYGGEAEADGVVFVHRPSMHISSEPPEQGMLSDAAFTKRLDEHHRRKQAAQGLAELVSVKARHGATGVYKLHFDGPTTSFEDTDDAPAPAPSEPPPDAAPSWWETG